MNQRELRRKVFWKYFFRKGRFINFKHPKLFTEKIQWLKVYDCTPIKTTLADKILVRDWVKEKIGGEYLKKIYAVGDKFEDLDLSNLPREYVIKTNHGCKTHIIFANGAQASLAYAKTFDDWLAYNYAYKSGFEMQYNDIKPKVFVEEYLKNTNELFEYLFYCFNGEPKFVLFASGKMSIVETTMFDIDWNNLHFNFGGNLHANEIPRPKNYELMVEIAKTLSKDFKFVRVDLHNIDGKIYFGEMTFTPNSGYMKFSNPKYDRIFGDLLRLE